MAIISCGSCASRLRLADEKLGKPVKCPRCGERILTTAMAPAVVPLDAIEVGEEEPPAEAAPVRTTAIRNTAVRSDETSVVKRKRSRVADEDWSKARLGVHLVYCGVCLAMGGMILCLFGFLVLGIGAMLGWAGSILSLIFFYGIGILFGGASWITNLVGQIFCCMSPNEKGARVLGIVSAVLFGITMLAYGLGVLLSAFLGPFGLIPSMLTGLAYSIVFLFYLRALALGVRARDVADNVKSLMIGVGIAAVACPVITIIIAVIASLLGAAALSSGSSSGGMIAAAGIPALLILGFNAAVAAALFAWYLRILIGVRDNLDKAMGDDYGGSPVWVPLFGASAALGVLDVIVLIIGVSMAQSRMRDQIAEQQRLNPPLSPVVTPMQPPVMPQPIMPQPAPPVVPVTPPPVVTPMPPAPTPMPMPMNPVVPPVNPMPNPVVPPGPKPPPKDPPANTRLTQANFDRIQLKMTRAQVVGILGNPTVTGPVVRVGTNTSQTLQWREGTAVVVIGFINGRVAAKNGTAQ